MECIELNTFDKPFRHVFRGKNSTTAAILGEILDKALINEMWILQLQPTAKWTQVDKNISRSVRPSARSNHAAVMVVSRMHGFGGIDAFYKCLHDLWVFNVDTDEWSEVEAVNEGPDLSDTSYCYYSAASTPGQLLISVNCNKIRGLGCNSEDVKMWMFVIHLRMWFLLTPSHATKL